MVKSKIIQTVVSGLIGLVWGGTAWPDDFMSLEEFKKEVNKNSQKHQNRDSYLDADKTTDLYKNLLDKHEAKNRNGAQGNPSMGQVNNTQNIHETDDASTPSSYSSRPRSVLDPIPKDQNNNGVLKREGSGTTQPHLPHDENTNRAGTEGFSTTPRSVGNRQRKQTKNQKKQQPNLTETRYIAPPPITSGQSSSMSYNAHEKNNEFGIWSSTWIDVELEREISSADTGSIELVLKSTVFGEYRELPKDTVFSAKVSFNRGTERVNLAVFSARLPDGPDQGMEFPLFATAYDLQKRNGLVGTILRDRESEVVDAMGAAAVDISKKAVDIMTPNNLVGEGVSSISNSLIDNENAHRPKKKTPVSVVPRQLLKLKIDKSF